MNKLVMVQTIAATTLLCVLLNLFFFALPSAATSPSSSSSSVASASSSRRVDVPAWFFASKPSEKQSNTTQPEIPNEKDDDDSDTTDPKTKKRKKAKTTQQKPQRNEKKTKWHDKRKPIANSTNENGNNTDGSKPNNRRRSFLFSKLQDLRKARSEKDHEESDNSIEQEKSTQQKQKQKQEKPRQSKRKEKESNTSSDISKQGAATSTDKTASSTPRSTSSRGNEESGRLEQDKQTKNNTKQEKTEESMPSDTTVEEIENENSNTTTPTTTATESTNTTKPTNDQDLKKQKPHQQQIVPFPHHGTMVLMGGPPTGRPPRGGPPPVGTSPPQPPNSAVILADVLGVVLSMATRLWFLSWIAKRIAFEEESMHPTQHFIWESVNDRYIRDEVALSNAIARPPKALYGENHDSRRNRRKWKQELNHTTSKQQDQQPQPKQPNAQTTRKTVIVLDVTPNPPNLDLDYISDAVTFLISQHAKETFGQNPEVVLLLHSPGGEVTSFGLAAAQLLRLRTAGMQTTACIDRMAASGGYMMASQASKIIAAPFAAVGSIGVMTEGLNFHELLRQYGVKPLILKSGDHKNILSSFGNVTDKDLEAEQERLESVHEAFIDLCVSQRPQMISSKKSCFTGTVFIGSEALELGMIDGIQTSEEYISQRLQQGAFVLQLHKSHYSQRERRKLLSTLDLLPHLQHQRHRLIVAFKNPENRKKVVGWLAGVAMMLSTRHGTTHPNSIFWGGGTMPER